MPVRPRSVIRVVPRVSLHNPPRNRTGAAAAGSTSTPSATSAESRQNTPRTPIVYTSNPARTRRRRATEVNHRTRECPSITVVWAPSAQSEQPPFAAEVALDRIPELLGEIDAGGAVGAA